MPTYDYQCRSCGTITEVIHAMTADGPTVCDRCGGDLRRVLYPAGIIFKGSGFYRNDSRAASGSTDGARSKPSTSTSGGETPKPSGTTDSSGSGSSSGSGDAGGTSGSSGGESAA